LLRGSWEKLLKFRFKLPESQLVVLIATMMILVSVLSKEYPKSYQKSGSNFGYDEEYQWLKINSQGSQFYSKI
jgi:hypothetical protein